MSKPFPRYWPLIALALLAAAVLLWWQGRPPAPAPAKPPAAAKATAPAPVPAPVLSDAPSASATASAPRNPAFAPLDAALAINDPGERLRAFYPQFQKLLFMDPEGALAYLRQMRRGSEFSQSLFMLLDNFSRKSVDRGLDLAAELATSREDRTFYSALFDRLARENLPLAREKLALVPAGDGRENALRALMDVSARADPAAALAWAQQLPNEADRNTAIETTLNELSSREPKRAIEMAKTALVGPARERAVARALQILASTDPVAASKLISELPPGETQTMTAGTIARGLALQDVNAAVAWVRTLTIDFSQWIALNNVLTVWAQKDPAAAMRYVLDLPPGQGQEFAATHLASLIGANHQDAIAWAEALPPDTTRAATFAMIASIWAQRAPADAVRWAASLNEDPQAPNAIGGAYSYWLLQDATAARAWLETAAIPKETKAQLMRR
jgi:hypothetical protein